MAGCADCLELVAEDLQEVTAQGGVEWRRTVRRPCPHCGKAAW